MLLGINAFAEAPFSATNLDLGNVKVVWTNGDNVTAAPRTDQPQAPAFVAEVGDDDLPF